MLTVQLAGPLSNTTLTFNSSVLSPVSRTLTVNLNDVALTADLAAHSGDTVVAEQSNLTCVASPRTPTHIHPYAILVATQARAPDGCLSAILTLR